MHIKSIVSDEDREELERMLSLGFIIPNQLFKTRQKALDRKSTRLNSSHVSESRMPSSA